MYLMFFIVLHDFNCFSLCSDAFVTDKHNVFHAFAALEPLSGRLPELHFLNLGALCVAEVHKRRNRSSFREVSLAYLRLDALKQTFLAALDDARTLYSNILRSFSSGDESLASLV